MRHRRLIAATLRSAEPQRPKAIGTSARSDDFTLVALRGALYAGLLRNAVSGDDAARRLHLHRRTLNRRLKDAGTTFRQMLDEVRFELAREMLSDTSLHITEIAARLGYRMPSAFTRAFRRWSGNSPARWREVASPTRDREHLRDGW
jgi:AraC-like DNA-binding protein